MKYFSMFSGIGGFELGIQQAYENKKMDGNGGQANTLSGLEGSEYGGGIHTPQADSEKLSDTWNSTYPTCIGYSEIDKYAIQIYERHFKHKNYGNATTINAAELPDFDLLVGGFPCQAFSIAGKRGGLEDARGTLFYDIARIAKEKRPQHLLLENVKGLLSHDNGRTFKLIISTFAELGYNLEWQVLNSKNFGVPQNRERVFIIGHLGRCCGRQVFPLRDSNSKVSILQGQQGITNTLTTRYTATGSGAYISERKLDAQTRPAQWRRTEKGREFRREAQRGGRDLTPFNNGFRELVPRESNVIGTITSQAIAKDSLLFSGMRIRRLTPTECERLQAYPDGWTEGVSDTQRYKTLGNSVTVSVIEHLIQKLYE